jgi:hypothetical protein
MACVYSTIYFVLYYFHVQKQKIHIDKSVIVKFDMTFAENDCFLLQKT